MFSNFWNLARAFATPNGVGLNSTWPFGITSAVEMSTFYVIGIWFWPEAQSRFQIWDSVLYRQGTIILFRFTIKWNLYKISPCRIPFSPNELSWRNSKETPVGTISFVLSNLPFPEPYHPHEKTCDKGCTVQLLYCKVWFFFLLQLYNISPKDSSQNIFYTAVPKRKADLSV